MASRLSSISTNIRRRTSTHAMLKVQWDDGYAGIVDLRPVIARGKVFTYLQKPENFEQLKIGEYGHGIIWTNEAGEQIDFGTDALRQRAERQAELHLVAG
jgi:Protein of unknown function (DUF2442)